MTQKSEPPSSLILRTVTSEFEPDPAGTGTTLPITSSSNAEKELKEDTLNDETSTPVKHIVASKVATTFPPSSAVGEIEGSNDNDGDDDDVGCDEGAADDDGCDEGAQSFAQNGPLLASTGLP